MQLAKNRIFRTNEIQDKTLNTLDKKYKINRLNDMIKFNEKIGKK